MAISNTNQYCRICEIRISETINSIPGYCSQNCFDWDPNPECTVCGNITESIAGYCWQQCFVCDPPCVVCGNSVANSEYIHMGVCREKCLYELDPINSDAPESCESYTEPESEPE